MAEKSPQTKKGVGCLKGCLIVLVAPILLFAVLIFFASIELRRSDEDILKTYQPTPEIAKIAEKDLLTNKGRATFYRAVPELVDNKSFIKYCQTVARGVESLACIVPRPGGGPFGGKKIFLMKIDDPRFSDHKYSAAAHEMLHMAYQRLGPSAEKRINLLLDQELTRHQDDPHLLSVIEVLKKRKNNSPEVIREELHSKFGVEYSDLLPELENHYQQYFNNRKVVVELYRNGGFDSRVRRIDELSYEARILNEKLTVMRNQLTTYQNAGDTANFNSLVPQFNSLVNQYNTRAAESKKVYAEIQEFYQYFKPDYQPPPEEKITISLLFQILFQISAAFYFDFV